MKDRLRELLRDLSARDGLPGQEQPVVRYLKEKWERLADEVSVGANGNIYAKKVGRRQGLTVTVAAHTDEIGCIVRDIDPTGFVRFDKLGAFSDTFLAGARVRIAGRIPGMIGIKSAHLMAEEEKRTVIPHRSLYIDVGARSARDVERLGVSVGDPIAFDVPFTTFQDPDYCCGKALDNRVACAVLTGLLERLADGKFDGTLWAVGTVQEERGLAGGRTAAYLTRPDWLMALDVAVCGDTPETPSGSRAVRLGAGVVVSLGDFLESPKKGHFLHPGLKKASLEVSRKKKIPLQLQALFGVSYTDASAASQEFSGIPCISFGIPTRYTHAPSSVCQLSDMESCLRLAEGLIRRGMEKEEFDFLGSVPAEPNPD